MLKKSIRENSCIDKVAGWKGQRSWRWTRSVDTWTTHKAAVQVYFHFHLKLPEKGKVSVFIRPVSLCLGPQVKGSMLFAHKVAAGLALVQVNGGSIVAIGPSGKWHLFLGFLGLEPVKLAGMLTSHGVSVLAKVLFLAGHAKEELILLGVEEVEAVIFSLGTALEARSQERVIGLGLFELGCNECR